MGVIIKMEKIIHGKKIDNFHGEYDFLSNFYPCEITFDGLSFRNSEAVYQAQKTLCVNERKCFCNLTGGQSKRKGQSILIRSDWNKIKDSIMLEVCKAKFSQNQSLTHDLLKTDGYFLIEGNNWSDFYWGVCNGKGKNKLGNILMKIREELKENN